MLVEALKLQISDSEWNVRKIEPLRKPSQVPFCFVTILLLSLSCSLGVIEKLGMGVVPYVVLLVVPVLGRMSDQCEDVRLMATYCFATLIRFMPLEVRSHGSVGNFRTSICDIWRHSVTCLNEYNKFDYKRCFNKQTKKGFQYPFSKLMKKARIDLKVNDKAFSVSELRISIMFRTSWERLFSDFSLFWPFKSRKH